MTLGTEERTYRFGEIVQICSELVSEGSLASRVSKEFRERGWITTPNSGSGYPTEYTERDVEVIVTWAVFLKAGHAGAGANHRFVDACIRYVVEHGLPHRLVVIFDDGLLRTTFDPTPVRRLLEGAT